MAPSDNDRLRQDIEELHEDFRRLRTRAGASLRRLEQQDTALPRRAQLGNLLGSNGSNLIARDLFVRVLDATYAIAEQDGKAETLPGRSELFDRYERLSARATTPGPAAGSPRTERPARLTQAGPPGPAVEVRVDARRVEIRDPQDGRVVVQMAHQGIDLRLSLRVRELEHRLLRAEQTEEHPFVLPANDDGLPLDEHESIGVEMGRQFLGGDVGRVLARFLDPGTHDGGRRRLALRVLDPQLAALPWENAVVPGMATSWCRTDDLQFYRPVDITGPDQPAPIASPLKILALIANPPLGHGLSPVHERGLEAVDESLNAARRQNLARIYEPAWGDLGSLRQELAERPCHVVYITCPVDRNGLVFETQDGRAASVSPRRLAGEVFGAVAPVPLVLLRGYATEPGADVWPMIHELVERLCAAGTLGVLVIPPGMSHPEAIRFTSRMFTHAATNPEQSILDVTSHARRQEQLDPQEQPRLYLRAAGVGGIVIDPSRRVDPPRSELRVADLPLRATSDFVGRRGELRTVLSTLLGPHPSIVITGIGGIGKSTLAGQALRVLGPARVGLLAAPQGEPSIGTIMAAIVSRLSIWVNENPGTGFEPDLRLLGNAQLGWRERLDLLAERILPNVPVTLLLDSFERHVGAERQIRDAGLADFLSYWVRLGDTARVLLTSRFPVVLAREAEPYMTTLRLGPLTLRDARRLAWRLHALDRLDHEQLRSAVVKVGGHPLTLEYFDALLGGTHARFPDVDARLNAALADRKLLQATDELAAGTAPNPDHILTETIAVTAREALLTELLETLGAAPDARELLVKASVYRQPVDDSGLWPMLGEDGPNRRYQDARDKLIDSELLAEVPPLDSVAPDRSPDRRRWIVHRWTADDLLRQTDAGTVRSAHEQAASYWLTVVDHSAREDPDRPVMAWLEEAHHLLLAGWPERSAWSTDLACSQLDVRGGYAWVMQICRDAEAELRGLGEAEAIVISRLGTSAARLARYREAADCLARALTIRQERGVTAGLASNLANIATLRQLHGEYGPALDLYRRSLAALGPHDDRSALATVAYNLGNLARRRGDLDLAQRFYERGLETSKQPDLSLALRDHTVEELAGMSAVPPSIDVASPLLSTGAWDLAAVERTTRGRPWLTDNLILRYRGEYPAAEQSLIAPHLRHAAAVQSVSIASGHCNLGVVAQTRGQYDRALERYDIAYSIYDDLHDLGRLPIVLHNQATLAQLRREWAIARDYYEQSQTMFSDINDVAGFSTGRHNLGALAQAEGDPVLAEELYAESDRLYEKLRDPIGRAGVAVNMGVLVVSRGDLAAAGDLYRAAWTTFAAAGDVLSCAATASNIGRLEVAAGTPGDGVRWSLYGLLARSRHGLTEAAIDLRTLAEQRRMLGRREFKRCLGEVLPQQADDLDRLVDDTITGSTMFREK
jgi:tetratricopeptide (TPR) repeat protein